MKREKSVIKGAGGSVSSESRQSTKRKISRDGDISVFSDYQFVDIERIIEYSKISRDLKIPKELIFPDNYYSKIEPSKPNPLQFVNLYAPDDTEGSSWFSKMALTVHQQHSITYENNFKKYRGHYTQIKSFSRDSTKIRQSVKREESSGSTTKTMCLDNSSKIIGGLQKEGFVEMYPAVESMNGITNNWTRFEKRCKKKHLSLYQLSGHSHYVIEVKKDINSVIPKMFLYLEFCNHLKQTTLNKIRVIELHINELIYVIVPPINDFNQWLDILCRTTGIEIDVQSRNTRGTASFFKSNMSGFTIWETKSKQLEMYSQQSDLKFIKKMENERYKLLDVYPDVFSHCDNPEHRTNRNNFFYAHILSVVVDMSLKISGKACNINIEPYLVRCHLWDMKNNVKLSEDVVFDVGEISILTLASSEEPESIDSLFKNNAVKIPSFKIKKAVFQLLYNYDDVYMIFYIMKIFEGSDGFDVYLKNDTKVAQKQHIHVAEIIKKQHCFYTNMGVAFRKMQIGDFGSEMEDSLQIYRYEAKMEYPKLIREHINSRLDQKTKLVPFSNSFLRIKYSVIKDLSGIDQRITSNFEPRKTFALPTNLTKITEVESSLAQNTTIEVLPLGFYGKFADLNFHNMFHVLYIYPLSINLSSCKLPVDTKNIILEFSVKFGNHDMQPLFFCPRGKIGFVTSVHVPICAKSTSSIYNYEIKMILPKELTPDMHLFINIYDINLKQLFKDSSKSKRQPKALLGTTWICLRRAINQDNYTKNLQLAVSSMIPKNYESIDMSGAASSEVKYLDSVGKPLINLSLVCASTLICLDGTFNSLLNLLKTKGLNKDVCEELTKLIKVSHAMRNEAILGGHRVILQVLCNIIILSQELSKTNRSKVCKSTTTLILQVLRTVHLAGYGTELASFIEEYLVVSENGRYVHGGLIGALPSFLSYDINATNKILDTFHYLLLILGKSLTGLALSNDRYNKNRTGMNSESTLLDIEVFIKDVASIVVVKFVENSAKMKSVNQELSNLMNLLINIMDRKFVIKLGSVILETFRVSDINHPEIHCLRYDFLRTLTYHEFFMHMSLPSLINLHTTKRSTLITKFYITQQLHQDHYFLAYLFDEIHKSFLDISMEKNTSVGILKSLLLKINYDDRFTKDPAVISHILHCFVPFLTIMVENVHLINKNSTKNADTTSDSTSIKGKLKATNSLSSIPSQLRKKILKTGTTEQNDFASSATPSVSNVNTSQKLRDFRDHFECALYVMQNISRTMLNEWISALPSMTLKRPVFVQNEFFNIYGQYCSLKQANLIDFLNFLLTALDVLKHEETRDLQKEVVREGLSSSFQSTTGSLRVRRGKNIKSLAEEKVNLDYVHSEEVVILIVFLLDIFTHVTKQYLETSSGNNVVNAMLLNVHATILEGDYSDYVYKYLFANLRLLIQKKPMAVFKGQNNFNERICNLIFKKITYLEDDIRKEASIFLYQLLKANYLFTGLPYQRTYIKIIFAATDVMNDEMIPMFVGKLLGTWLRLVKEDGTDKMIDFTNEVYDLTRRINSILRVGKLSKEHEGDAELSIDILYNLTSSFSETPELLIGWYRKIQKAHEQNNYFSEAAMCSLHAVSTLVQILKQNKIVKTGLDDLKEISDNIQLHSFLAKQEEIIDYENESIFSLYKELIKCSKFLISAERYESVGSLFKTVIPLLEDQKAYGELGMIYKRLSESFEKIADQNVANKRNFGAYFRVGFFGPGFLEDNGKQLIYREPPYTPLVSIKERLENIAKMKKLDPIVVLESGNVKREKDRNYIQINAVTPSVRYYDEQNVSDFEANTNIREFVLETPFTKSGKAVGSVSDQCIRITKFHTYHAFPYMKKRVHILYKDVIEMTPIEVAIKEMTTQVKQLNYVSTLMPPDMKRLQLKLQGSVSAQVNAGSLAYAEEFLSQENRKRFDSSYVCTLIDIFISFVEACETALQLNGELIKADQYVYHSDLVSKFEQLKETLEQYMIKTK